MKWIQIQILQISRALIYSLPQSLLAQKLGFQGWALVWPTNAGLEPSSNFWNNSTGAVMNLAPILSHYVYLASCHLASASRQSKGSDCPSERLDFFRKY